MLREQFGKHTEIVLSPVGHICLRIISESFLINLEPFRQRHVELITSNRSTVSQVSYNGSCTVWPLEIHDNYQYAMKKFHTGTLTKM